MLLNFTKVEEEYILHINQRTNNPNYGLLKYTEDPSAFQEGLKIWYNNLSTYSKIAMGIRIKRYEIQATRSFSTTVYARDETEAIEKLRQNNEKGEYDSQWNDAFIDTEILEEVLEEPDNFQGVEELREASPAEGSNWILSDRFVRDYVRVGFDTLGEIENFINNVERLGYNKADFVITNQQDPNPSDWDNAGESLSLYLDQDKNYRVRVKLTDVYEPINVDVTEITEERASEKAREQALEREKDSLTLNTTKAQIEDVSER